MSKFAITSDLHGFLPGKDEYEIPEECDYLLVCGDISPLRIQGNIPEMKLWLEKEFIPWCNSVAPETILVAGNHDFIFERTINSKELFPRNIHYLENEFYETPEGIKIFGTPYCHIFGNWPFMREDENIKKKWEEIPEGLDILLSHDSPHLCGLGTIQDPSAWNWGKECGNSLLRDFIILKKPKYFFSGHIHTGNHELNKIPEGTQLANVSIKNEEYVPVYEIRTLEI